jgi:hypothetical protein
LRIVNSDPGFRIRHAMSFVDPQIRNLQFAIESLLDPQIRRNQQVVSNPTRLDQPYTSQPATLITKTPM